ncbi:MAG: DUF2608 domain-containing protein [Pseudomonadota bacterium]
MPKHLFTAALLSGALTLPLYAQTTSVDYFAEMASAAVDFTEGDLDGLLVVMDDDDTLTQVPCTDASASATCQYLGGPAWYSWQQDLVNANSTSPYRIAETSDDLIALSAMLFGMMDMGYTDPAIPDVLGEMAALGAKMLVLTARGGADVSPTQTQFADQMSADGSTSFADFIAAHALHDPASKLPSLASPMVMNTPASCATKREVTYSDGVLYGAGQDKGLLLRCLLTRTESSDITHIVFIDDTLANVTAVANAFPPGSEGPAALPLYYTRLEAHKAALTTGPDAARLQDIAAARWAAIEAALLGALLSPIPALE